MNDINIEKEIKRELNNSMLIHRYKELAIKYGHRYRNIYFKEVKIDEKNYSFYWSRDRVKVEEINRLVISI